MDPIITALVATGAAAATRVVIVLLLLRWHAVQERARQQSLITLAACLGTSGDLEEIRADGSRVRLSLSRAQLTRDYLDG